MQTGVWRLEAATFVVVLEIFDVGLLLVCPFVASETARCIQQTVRTRNESSNDAAIMVE